MMCTCYIRSFKILASFCSWAGWFQSYLVKNTQRHIFAWCGSYDYQTQKHTLHTFSKPYWTELMHILGIFVESTDMLNIFCSFTTDSICITLTLFCRILPRDVVAFALLHSYCPSLLHASINTENKENWSEILLLRKCEQLADVCRMIFSVAW